jgi:hypothetical protein
MPSTLKTVNPYLTPPDHITTPQKRDSDDIYQNDTNILHSANDAHQPTSKWSSHEEKESRPPAPHNSHINTIHPPLTSTPYSLRRGNDEDIPCKALSGASLSLSCDEDNFYSIPHMEDHDDTSSTFTTHPYHPSPPTGSSNGCARQLTSKNRPRQTPQPHDPIDHNTNEYKKEILTTIYTQNAQGLWRCPRDPDGNILVDQPPDLSKLEYIIDYMQLG